MPRRLALLTGAVLCATVLAACSGGSPAPPLDSAAPAPASATAAAPTGAASWVMPNLVGVGLQDAQDRMQALTGDPVFVTTSHDATGSGRQQLVDRNWKVCEQNVAPGTRITLNTPVDFGAVKLEERC